MPSPLATVNRSAPDINGNMTHAQIGPLYSTEQVSAAVLRFDLPHGPGVDVSLQIGLQQSRSTHWLSSEMARTIGRELIAAADLRDAMFAPAKRVAV